jgi:hypothetical protein
MGKAQSSKLKRSSKPQIPETPARREQSLAFEQGSFFLSFEL